MKFLTTHLVVLAATPAAFGLVPLLDHIDLAVNYRPADSSWEWLLKTENEDIHPALAYFPARDAEYPDGEKDYRPAGSEWDFTGVAAEEALWIYPESNDAYSWLGFGDTAAGLADPVKFTLTQALGPAGGHFALYRTIQGQGVPTIFMSTADGINAADVYAKPQGHHHLNWSFSRKGMWALDLRVSALRSPSNLPTVAGPTDTTRLFFAIGEKATWRANRFEAANVMDETIAGEMADPDQDGWVNLLEYAFGGDPRQNGLRRSTSQASAAPVLQTIIHSGQNYAGITFYRQRDAALAELEYAVEWQSGLASNAWITGGELHHTELIDTKWERVTYRDSQPLTTAPRFIRIRVTAQ